MQFDIMNAVLMIKMQLKSDSAHLLLKIPHLTIIL